MPFVYMIRCADESLYTGWTTDVVRRVAEHNSGRAARYTRSRCPVALVYYEEVPDRSSALRREAEIRCLRRSAKLALVAAFHPTDA